MPIPFREQTIEAGGMKYRLTLLHGAELSPLVLFFRTFFRRTDFTLDWLEQKYACDYGGVEGFVAAALTENGQVAASLGVLPWPIRLGGRVELAAQLVDGATDSAHRRRGLFVALGAMAQQVCDDGGLHFMLGFAYQQAGSFPGLVKGLDYAHLGDLVEYRKPIRTLWTERIAHRVPPLQPIYRSHVERTLAPHYPSDPTLQNSLLAEGFAGTNRDWAFHAYKGFAGSRVISVDGGRAWVKVRHGLQVADIEAQSDGDMARSVAALERIAARLGLHQVVFQSSRDTRFTRFFERRYQVVPCTSVVYKNLRSQIPVDQLRFTFGDQDNF